MSFHNPFLMQWPTMNRGAGAAIGGWKELVRTTLGSAGDNIQASSIPNKRYYQILINPLNSGTIQTQLQAGNSTLDTGNNYSGRFSNDGGADGTQTSQSDINCNDGLTSPTFLVGYIANLSAKEKLFQGHTVSQNTAGAGTAPRRYEWIGKWANTSNVLDIINAFNRSTGDYASGSELVINGWDSSDVHTTNFWEQLYQGTGTSIDTGVSGFSAKKYLWIQIYQDGLTSATAKAVLNGDTGATNALRYSLDGGADSTFTSNSSGLLYRSGVTGDDEAFTNIFILNRDSAEKLAITHNVISRVAGAGTSPHRQEIVNKSTVSAQITDIELTGTYGSNSIMTIWGSD